MQQAYWSRGCDKERTAQQKRLKNQQWTQELYKKILRITKELAEEKKLKERIDTVETKLKRPGQEDLDQKAEIPGAAEYKKSF